MTTLQQLTDQVDIIIENEFQSFHTVRQAHNAVWRYIRRHDGLEQILRNAFQQARQMLLGAPGVSRNREESDGTVIYNLDYVKGAMTRMAINSNITRRAWNFDQVCVAMYIRRIFPDLAESPENKVTFLKITFSYDYIDVRFESENSPRIKIRYDKSTGMTRISSGGVEKVLEMGTNLETDAARDLCLLLSETKIEIETLVIDIQRLELCHPDEVGHEGFLEKLQMIMDEEYDMTIKVKNLKMKIFETEKGWAADDSNSLLSVLLCVTPGCLKTLSLRTLNPTDVNIQMSAVSTEQWKQLKVLDMMDGKVAHDWRDYRHLEYVGIRKLTVQGMMDVITTFVDNPPRREVSIETKLQFEIPTFIILASRHSKYIRVTEEEEEPFEYNTIYFRFGKHRILGFALKRDQIIILPVYPQNQRPDLFKRIPIGQSNVINK
ncbi:unnamed protein product [Caenorhabditis nigoni]